MWNSECIIFDYPGRPHVGSGCLAVHRPMLFRPSGTLALTFRKALCFSRDVYLFIYFLISQWISELPRPIATKL